ncbi:MAG TPA: hypothetical protein ENF63_02625 [Candidatus Bathyarchaeota archaeon]|nr:hypothetical protein [Candidatus Bathyarchaeota archaeon]
MRLLHERSAELKTVDIALISVLSAMWIVLHLYFGPLGFQLLHLPIFCDISAFLTLIIAVWIIGKFGGASAIGIIGSLIVMGIRSAPFQLGFLASAIIFDVLCLAVRHKPLKGALNALGLSIFTIISAYIAGVIIGVFFMTGSTYWALTFWGGWHAVGGLLSVIIALPIIGALEKAGVRTLKGET